MNVMSASFGVTLRLFLCDWKVTGLSCGNDHSAKKQGGGRLHIIIKSSPSDLARWGAFCTRVPVIIMCIIMVVF